MNDYKTVCNVAVFELTYLNLIHKIYCMKFYTYPYSRIYHPKKSNLNSLYTQDSLVRSQPVYAMRKLVHKSIFENWLKMTNEIIFDCTQDIVGALPWKWQSSAWLCTCHTKHTCNGWFQCAMSQRPPRNRHVMHQVEIALESYDITWGLGLLNCTQYTHSWDSLNSLGWEMLVLSSERRDAVDNSKSLWKCALFMFLK